MICRSSERSHRFQTALFERLGAFSLQGLLQDEEREFTTAVEAVMGEPDDDRSRFPYVGQRKPAVPFVKGMLPFTAGELRARCVLAGQLHIPFYMVCFLDGLFFIMRVQKRHGRIWLLPFARLDEAGFAGWWESRKRTVQTKRLYNGGERRLRGTVFDAVLRAHGLEWGGNIDGFLLSEDGTRVRCIIDNISVSRPNLADDPARYFNSPNPRHGPRYEGWYAAVKLASDLDVPHIVMTLDRNDERAEHVGIAVTRALTPEGLFYVDGVPTCDNIVEGLDNIVRYLDWRIPLEAAPELVERQ